MPKQTENFTPAYRTGPAKRTLTLPGYTIGPVIDGPHLPYTGPETNMQKWLKEQVALTKQQAAQSK